MKPGRFTYHAPTTVDDAVALLAQHGDEAKPLAGGQSLVPILALRLARFPHLVDLNRIPSLRGIERTNGTVRIGAMTRQAEVERSAELAQAVPLLARATPLIGHFQIRNRGTVGGSIAHADPASEYPAVALALDATIEVQGPQGTRRISARDFFVSTWTTAMEAEEILTAVEFPVWQGRSAFAVQEIARRHGDFALAGVACGVGLDGSGAVQRCAIGLFGVGATPVRATAAEEVVVGSSEPDLAEAGRAGAADLSPTDDVHASGAYRKKVAAVLVERALRAALEEARRG